MTASAGEGVIDRDVDCIACGYNLRGLRADGVCPECGGGIGESLKDRGIAGADAGWRRVLRRGLAVGAVEYLTMMAIVLLMEVMDVERAAVVLFGGMGASAGLGGWWVTRREPGRTGGWLGIGVRGMSVVVVMGYGVMLLMDKGWWTQWYRVGSIAFLVANAVKTGLQMGVLARLTGRVPGRGLARVGKWMVGVGPAVWAGMLVEQWSWAWQWVDWAVIAWVALACAAVVVYSGWFYVVLRGRREAVA